jgi:hypothetical protein
VLFFNSTICCFLRNINTIIYSIHVLHLPSSSLLNGPVC